MSVQNLQSWLNDMKNFTEQNPKNKRNWIITISALG